MRSERRSSAKPADGAKRRPEESLPAEVLALLDYLAEEIAAEYLRLLTPEPGARVEGDRLRKMEVER